MVKITARKNGPLMIEADANFVMVKDGSEQALEQSTIFLCRCGQSQNKPFCDGSHKTANFQAEGVELIAK